MPTIANGEAQEFDHLLVTSYGVIAIESKNYAGTIAIKNDGTWYHNDKAISSPYAQVKRHNLILNSILASAECPLHSFVCIANESTHITGQENTKLDVVSIRDLDAYLDKIITDSDKLPNNKVHQIFEMINQSKVDKNKE